MEFKIENETFEGLRIDVAIKKYLADDSISRTYIDELIDDSLVKVNGEVIYKSSYKTKLGDVIEFTHKEVEVLDVKEENIPLDIVYEDDDLLIVNKPRGMCVHPSNGHLTGTLVNAVMYHCKDNLSSINGVIRPGIVHRIDKDTSGILCICKNDFAHKDVAKQFADHTNVRKYIAIVRGIIQENEGIIDKPIGRDKNNRLRMAIDKNGKEAKTYYKVLKKFKEYTYIECKLFTGRTHQIRVHMKDLGHPLLGDLVYGRADKNFKITDGQFLHAYYLEFDHPRTKERLKFEVDIPDYFKKQLDDIDKLSR